MMTEPGKLSDEELLGRAHQLRLLALRGHREARGAAHRHEVEVRRRFGVPSTMGAPLESSPTTKRPFLALLGIGRAQKRLCGQSPCCQSPPAASATRHPPPRNNYRDATFVRSNSNTEVFPFAVTSNRIVSLACAYGSQHPLSISSPETM